MDRIQNNANLGSEFLEEVAKNHNRPIVPKKITVAHPPFLFFSSIRLQLIQNTINS